MFAIASVGDATVVDVVKGEGPVPVFNDRQLRGLQDEWLHAEESERAAWPVAEEILHRQRALLKM